MSLVRSLERKAIRFLRRRGYEFTRDVPMDSPSRRRQALMRELGIDLVLDVGANVGQFARDLRASGYEGRIVSFEPMKAAYSVLSREAIGDDNWTTLPYGIGSADTSARINVAGNSFSSSILEMLPLHLQSAPDSANIGVETIEVRRLDAIFAQLRGAASRIWLKIDTQGYELEVLKGAAGRLDEISVVQAELSLEPLYGGGPLFDDVYSYLVSRQFTLASVELGHFDPGNGRLLQIDGIFRRRRQP